MIAIALPSTPAHHPDDPTTALDATVQAQIRDLCSDSIRTWSPR